MSKDRSGDRPVSKVPGAPRTREGITGSTFELACGGLVWRDGRPSGSGSARQILVVHRQGYDDWSLPKGKFEPEQDATVVDCALREVLEETGVRARAGAFAGQTMYLKSGKPKLVLFWTMTLEHVGSFEANDEIAGIEWLTRDEALKRLTHVDERRLVQEHP